MNIKGRKNGRLKQVEETEIEIKSERNGYKGRRVDERVEGAKPEEGEGAEKTKGERNS